MLVLTRKIGEKIVIGEYGGRAEVTVIGVKGNQIRLGIQAPSNVPVHREEIYKKIMNEQLHLVKKDGQQN